MIFRLLDFSPPQQLSDAGSSGTKRNSCEPRSEMSPLAAATSLMQELSSGSWEVADDNAKLYLKCISVHVCEYCRIFCEKLLMHDKQVDRLKSLHGDRNLRVP